MLTDIRESEYNNEYIFVANLGQGGFGKVTLAENKITNELVAIKEIQLSDNSNLNASLNEVNNLMRISKNPKCYRYVVCYYDIFIDKNTNKLYIVMEYIKGKELDEYFNSLPDDNNKFDIALKIFSYLLEGLNYIHENGIVHADIKPANILIQDDTLEPIFIDFGISCDFTDNINKPCDNVGGTLTFIEPERLYTHLYTSVNYKSDIYQLGLTMAFILGKNYWPFKKSGSELSKYGLKDLLEYKNNPYNYIKITTSNTTLNMSINHSLEVNPNKRPDTSELLEWMDLTLDVKWTCSNNKFFPYENTKQKLCNIYDYQPSQLLSSVFEGVEKYLEYDLNNEDSPLPRPFQVKLKDNSNFLKKMGETHFMLNNDDYIYLISTFLYTRNPLPNFFIVFVRNYSVMNNTKTNILINSKDILSCIQKTLFELNYSDWICYFKSN